jgi:hypothetical protein
MIEIDGGMDNPKKGQSPIRAVVPIIIITITIIYLYAEYLQLQVLYPKPVLSLGQACSTFYMARANLAKFCLHVGNRKCTAQNEEGIGMDIYIYVEYNFTVYLSIHNVQ